MSRTDRARRVVTLALTVALLVAAPSVAFARFNDTKVPAQSVGTASMVTPSAITGTYTCTRSGKNERITITVTGFSDAGQVSGSTYGFAMILDGAFVDNDGPKSGRTTMLDYSMGRDNKSTTWTVGIQAFRGSWSSAAGVDSVTCPSNDTGVGIL